MSFSDLFDSGFKKRNEGHFAAIVRVAMSDGDITEAEKKFLDRLANRLSISVEDYKSILQNYKSHPINPPNTYNRRLERLYDLARMVSVDPVDLDQKKIILDRICVGLGFRPENIIYIRHKSLELVAQGLDLDEFIDEIKNMNS